MQLRRPTWSSQTKTIVVLLIIGLLIYLLYRFNTVVKPVILALILAYVLTPLANWFQRRWGIQRWAATLLSYLVVIVIVLVFLAVLVPPLVVQASNLDLNLQQFIRQVEAFLRQQYSLAGVEIDMGKLSGQLDSLMSGGLLEPVFGRTLTLMIEVISSLIWVIFISVVTFYLVKDGPVLSSWIESLVPLAYRDDFNHIRQELTDIWSSFFRGQLMLALIVMVGFTVVGLLIGLPFVLPMAILAGLLEFLPSLGHGIWLFVASILAFLEGSSWLPIPNWAFMLLVIGLHLFFEQFDINYLIPRVVGRRVRLPPLVVILGIVAGAVLAGVIGILLAAPTIASMRVLGRYVYANLTDEDPFPVPIASTLPPPNARWWRKARVPAAQDGGLESK